MYVVQKAEHEGNYNEVLESICRTEFYKILANMRNLVKDENGNALPFNVGDICNVVTQVAQAHRKTEPDQP